MENTNTGKNRRKLETIKKRTDMFYEKSNRVAFAQMAEALKKNEFSSIEEEILELKDLHNYIVRVERRINDPSLREVLGQLRNDREVILETLCAYAQDMKKLGEI